jgi:hypothetical protein
MKSEVEWCRTPRLLRSAGAKALFGMRRSFKISSVSARVEGPISSAQPRTPRRLRRYAAVSARRSTADHDADPGDHDADLADHDADLADHDADPGDGSGSVTASFVNGTGIADQYTGLTRGIAFPSLPNPLTSAGSKILHSIKGWAVGSSDASAASKRRLSWFRR